MNWRDEPERQPDDTWNYDREPAPDDQPTTVIPLRTKRCEGPDCTTLLVYWSSRRLCEPCERLWKAARLMRNRLVLGTLSDWPNMHHEVGMSQYAPAFSATSDFEDAVWVAMFKASWCPWNWGTRWDDPDEQ